MISHSNDEIFPQYGSAFWEIVNYFIESCKYTGTFAEWYCTDPEFRESAIEWIQESLNDDNFTIDQKVKITQALLAII